MTDREQIAKEVQQTVDCLDYEDMVEALVGLILQREKKIKTEELALVTAWFKGGLEETRREARREVAKKAQLVLQRASEDLDKTIKENS